MEDLINSLLHFSRLGREELNLQMTDLNKLVHSAIDVLKLSFNKSNVDIRIPRPLPTIRCDRIQTSEVFSNLISNAIKYKNCTEKWVEIGYLDAVDSPSHSLLQVNDENSKPPIVFYVRDNGIGIRQQHLDTIFRIFKRLHGKNQYGGGTGAGLTIVKKIVERHNGRIWVESTYGEGSTFYFALPRWSKLNDWMTTNSINPLLVIEDSDEDFFAFERMVRKSSFANPIYRCSNGDEALNFLYHSGEYADPVLAPRPAMILLDLNLPGLDGRDVLGQIKQDTTLQTIPVVVFTTSSNPKDIEVCYQRGVNGYIIKPIDVSKLRQVIQFFIAYWFEFSILPSSIESWKIFNNI